MRALSTALASLQTRTQQRGQAVAEMLIASVFLLVPLLLVMTLLMKYINMASTVQQAARYAAFQRTIFMSNNSLRGATVAATRSNVQIENAVRMRFFSGGVNNINNGQNQGTGTFAALSLWKDTTNQSMVAAASAASLSLTDGSSPSQPDQTIGTFLKPLQSLGVGFDLNFNGLMTANISLQPKPPNGSLGYDNLATPSLYATLLGTLVFSAHDTVLADGWSAAHPANVKQQINGVLPTSVFKPVQSALQIISKVLPDLTGLKLGYVLINTPIEVPADRSNYNPSPPGGGSKAQSTMIAQLIKQYSLMGYSSSTQTKNSNGSITLSFTKGDTVIRQIVQLDGSTSAPISTTIKNSSAGVAIATQNQINQLASKGFKVDKGYPTYKCRVIKKVGKKTVIITGKCEPSDITNPLKPFYKGTVISSKTILHKITKYQGKKSVTTTTQAVLTVKLASGGGSDIKIVITTP